MSSQPAHVPTQTEVIVTGSVHEATMLGTLGVKPFKLKKGPEKTEQGNDKVKWIYICSPTAEEAIAYWRSPKRKEFEWENLSKDQKELVMSYVTAFAGNIKHYLAHTR